METKQIYQIYEILDGIDTLQNRFKICENIKKYRVKFYKKYKEENGGGIGYDNPYSVFNISGYLGISESHYRRIEARNDKHKYMSLDNLIKLSYIFNIKLDDFLK